MSLTWIMLGLTLYCIVTLIREWRKAQRKARRRRRRSLRIEQFIIVKEDNDDHR